eukprot:3891210-Pleurochrysis_carterae.AAC.3
MCEYACACACAGAFVYHCAGERVHARLLVKVRVRMHVCQCVGSERAQLRDVLHGASCVAGGTPAAGSTS